MRQRIDNSTANFIGTPKAFTEFKPLQYVEYSQSVAVAPGANIVFFTEFGQSCRKAVLWAQVFDPQTSGNVGPPQLLITCSELSATYSGISGIDIARFVP